MKKYILLVCTFWVSALIPVMGQSFIFNGDTLKGSICMIDDSLQNDTMLIDADTWAMAKDTTHGWYTRGDVKIKTTLDSIVYFTSIGPGKGGVYFTYGTPDCGDFVKGSEIYKDFSPDKYELAIKGPDCLKEGDTAVYSVDPIFTKNLGDFIGIDNYYWNINQKPYPSFVDTIIYVSGDGSSITFVAGAVSKEDSIVVNFGRCNQDEAKRVVKHLDKKAPEIFIEDTCIAVNSRVVTFRIPNPQEGLFYKWLIPSPQFSAQSSSIGDSISVKLNDNSNGEITVLSSYDKNNWDGCSVSTTSFMVNRMMGSGNKVSSDKTCYAVNDTAHIKITGTLPDNTRFKWQYPTGWNLVLEDGETEEDVMFRDSIKLVATEEITDSVINATMLGCRDVKTPDIHVYVRPAGVGDIIGERCVSRDDSVWYHVDRSANKPYAHHFEWLLPEGMEEIRSTPMKDSIYVHVKTTGELGTITVIPQGSNSACEGPASSKQIFLEAQVPSGIAIKHCIASGMNDIDTFSVISPREGQSYRWILPLGMDSLGVSDNDTAIYVSTNGVPGKYPVKVQEIGGVECGDSQIFVDTFTINTALFSIATDVYRTKRNFYLDPWDLEDIREYKWYINGNYEGNSTEVSVPSNTISAFVEVYVTFNDGCQQYDSLDFNSGSTRMAPHKAENKMEIATAEKNLLDFKVYPNPSQENINVMFPSYDSYLIQLFDMKGRVVYRKLLDADNIVIPTDNLSNGVYSVVVTQGDSKLSKQVIVNK